MVGGRRSGHPAQVEREVEVGIELPAWRCRTRRRHHPLPEHRHRSTEQIEPIVTSFQSGDRSSKISETMVDRRRGSASIDQMNASLLRRNSAMSRRRDGHVDGQALGNGVRG